MEHKEELYNLLQEHLTRHAGMEWMDVYKLLYQGVFGGEHLLGDVQMAEKAFRDEWRRTSPKSDEQLMERVSLDGNRVRANFSRCKYEGISSEWVWEAFVRSRRSGDPQMLPELLTAFVELCREGRLPFQPQLVQHEIEKLLADGLPPQHHSSTYRKANHPAYRVVEKAIFIEILAGRSNR